MQHLQYEEGQRFFLFPDGQGKVHLIDTEEKDLQPRYSAQKDVNLLLFTRYQLNTHVSTPICIFKLIVHFKDFLLFFRQNPNSAQVIIYRNGASLDASNFDKSKPTKFIAHGWTDDANSDINAVVKDGKNIYTKLHQNISYNFKSNFRASFKYVI